MQYINQALAFAQTQGLERLDAQLLMLHTLGTKPAEFGAQRAWLLAHGDERVDAKRKAIFHEYVRRRIAGEPLAYITGHKEFFGLDLKVDARVLVPRPDTETLVLWALELLAGPMTACFAPPLAVLDLGTGSGAIALALKHEQPQLQVDAVDVSPGALAVARANAARLRLAVRFRQGSWFDPVDRQYHCVVTNPPYIAANDPHLNALVYEPQAALVSGADGLRDIRHIVAATQTRLHPGGWLLLEHGFDQADRVRDIFTSAGYQDIASRVDLGGQARCTGGHVPGKILEVAPIPAKYQVPKKSWCSWS